MLKQSFFILFSFIFVSAGTSQGLVSDLLCNPSSVGTFTNVPAVNTFVNTFLRAVTESETLRDLFDLSKTTSKKYSDFAKMHTAQTLKGNKVDDQTATALGNFLGQAIPQIKSLTSEIVSKVIANGAAKFLFVDGVLKQKNAESLAKSLAKTMEDRSKGTVTSDPTSKFPAINNGFDTLFMNDGEFKPTKTPILAVELGNEWVLAANNPC